MDKHRFAHFFIISLCLLYVFRWIAPTQAISLRENRQLTTYDDVSRTSFLDHSYQRTYEDYLSDQFLLREEMSAFRGRMDQGLGRRDIQDVLVGKQQELFQMPTMYHEAQIEQLAAQIHAFTSTYPSIAASFLLVPNKLAIQDQYAPNFIDTQAQQRQIEEVYDTLREDINTIDATGILSAHKEKYLYYHGDHHWTSLGASLVAEEYLHTKGIEMTQHNPPLVVNDAFYGTLANATGFAIRDTIEIYPRKEDVSVLVNYVEEKKKTTSVYEMEKQYSFNPYEIFLDGNHALVEITTSVKEERNLLLFKDSYANCFIPFLLPYYHSIIVVDARYYYGDIASLIQKYRINEALFLYNANTLFEDTSLLTFLSEEFEHEKTYD